MATMDMATLAVAMSIVIMLDIISLKANWAGNSGFV